MIVKFWKANIPKGEIQIAKFNTSLSRKYNIPIHMILSSADLINFSKWADNKGYEVIKHNLWLCELTEEQFAELALRATQYEFK